MPLTKKHQLFTCLLLGIIPIIFWYLRLDIIASRGPFWMGYNSDPAYGYLMNSLNVAFYNGGIGRQLLHPGIPIYYFGAVIIWGVFVYRFIFENLEVPFNGGLQTDVLQHPELYLDAINLGGFLLNISLLSWISWLVYKYSKKWSYALLIQALPLYAEIFLTEAFAKVSAEFMLMFASVLFLGYVLISLLKNGTNSLKFTFLTGQGKKYSISYDALFMGIFCGFGLSVKLPFIAYWIIPVIIIWNRKEVFKFLFIAITTFLIWMLPVIFRFYIPLKFWFDITAHSGNYGSGEVSLINFAAFFKNFSTILSNYPFIPVVLLLVGSLVFLVVKRNKFDLKTYWNNRIFRAFVALLFGWIGNLVMVSKHYQNRYLLSLFCILPFLVLLALLVLKAFPLTKKENNKWMRCALFCVPFLTAIFTYKNWQQTKYKFQTEVQQRTLAHTFLQNETAQYIAIYKYGSSDQRYALRFGDSFARSLNGPKLEEIYGDFYHYNFTFKEVFNWNRTVPIKQLDALQKDIIIIGNSEYISDIEQLFNRKTRLLKDFGVEQIYLLEKG